MRGAKSPQNGFFIRLLVLGCFIAPLTMGNWRSSLLMFGVWFLIVRPLAGAVGPHLAVRLYRAGEQGPFERWVGRPPTRMRRIYSALEQSFATTDSDIQAFMRNSERRSMLKSAALDYALGQPDIQAVLRRYGADRALVESLFSELIASGVGGMSMGHYLPEAIAYYPRTLSFVLAWNANRGTLSQADVAMRLIRYFETGQVLPPIE